MLSKLDRVQPGGLERDTIDCSTTWGWGTTGGVDTTGASTSRLNWLQYNWVGGTTVCVHTTGASRSGSAGTIGCSTTGWGTTAGVYTSGCRTIGCNRTRGGGAELQMWILDAARSRSSINLFSNFFLSTKIKFTIKYLGFKICQKNGRN